MLEARSQKPEARSQGPEDTWGFLTIIKTCSFVASNNFFSVALYPQGMICLCTKKERFAEHIVFILRTSDYWLARANTGFAATHFERQ